MINISWEENIIPPLNENDLIEILEKFLNLLNLSNRDLNICFLHDSEMEKLNLEYRDKEDTTDILSWSYLEEDEDAELLGELALSSERIEKQAEENNWDIKTETIRLLAHGCAHITGYTHNTHEDERVMLSVEKMLLKAVDLEYVYELVC